MKIGTKVRVVRVKDPDRWRNNLSMPLVQNRRLGSIGRVKKVYLGYSSDTAEVRYPSGKVALHRLDELEEIK